MTAPAAPPEIRPEIEMSLAWIDGMFRRYYQEHEVAMPSRFARREFGFLWNGRKGFDRHRGFTSPGDLNAFLRREAPHHAYHSTAFYRTPGAPTMQEKTWLGADLIFDLDADHLPNADKMGFAEQLAIVKKEATKLLDEFLFNDFGFDERHVKIVFSGARGYHFHVTDPRVHQMSSAARREVVDYVSPNEMIRGLIMNQWIREREHHHEYGTERLRLIAKARQGGWPGHLSRTLATYLEGLAALPEDDAIARLMDIDGIGEARAKRALRSITPHVVQRLREDAPDGPSLRRSLHEMLNEDLDQSPAVRDWMAGMVREHRFVIPKGLDQKPLLEGLFQKIMVLAEGETDEPVTADIKRLIRLPGTLHGKTALRVVPLTLEEFRGFDPLRDAIALPRDEQVRVLVSKEITIPLPPSTLKLEPGEHTVGAHQAAFAILRRAATITS